MRGRKELGYFACSRFSSGVHAALQVVWWMVKTGTLKSDCLRSSPDSEARRFKRPDKLFCSSLPEFGHLPVT